MATLAQTEDQYLSPDLMESAMEFPEVQITRLPQQVQSLKAEGCSDCHPSQSPLSLQQRQSFSFQDRTVPREVTKAPRLVTNDPESARDLLLTRGQYRVSALIPDDGKIIHHRDIMKAIPIDGEFKRVFFYKIDVTPVAETHRDGAEEIPLARITAVFHVLDNPLPLIPIIWGAAIIGSLTAGWVVIDKVEDFAGTATGSLLLTAAALIGGYAALKGLSK